VFAAELCCLQRINIRCRIVFLAVDQCLLSNYSVCSKLAFATELCCLQWIRCPLPNYSAYSELAFATELCCL